MARTLRGIAPDGTKYVVHFDRDWREWQVRAYKKRNGVWKFAEGPTYYSHDKEDAVQTFWHIVGHGPAGTHVNPRGKMSEKLYVEFSKALARVPADEGSTMRGRWDALWSNGGSALTNAAYKEGLNDNHIDTALRQIFSDLKARQDTVRMNPRRRKIRRRRSNPSLTHGDVTQAVLDICKYVQSYGMAVVGANGDIHWLDRGSVTCCGHVRTAARTAGQAVLKHAIKQGDTRSANKMIDLLAKANLYY